jgi:hypothetical protein
MRASRPWAGAATKTSPLPLTARREREDAIRATYWTLDDIENLDLKEPAADA